MNLDEALKNTGLVTFGSQTFGKYICSLERVDRHSRLNDFIATVTVLAVLEYPSQRAILQRTFYDRKPHAYKTKTTAPLEQLKSYESDADESYFDKEYYDKSVKIALVAKINQYGLVSDHEKAILLEHLDEIRGVKSNRTHSDNLLRVNFNPVIDVKI